MSKSKFDAILGRIREEDTITDEIIGGGSQSSGGGGTVAVGSPLTTKGDIYGYDVADARVPVGTDGQFLTADSSTALGVKWASQVYTEFIYDSSATQSGNVYSVWSDLIAALALIVSPKRVTFVQNEVVSLGTGISLNNTTLNGNGQSYFSGGISLTITGGTISSWTNAVVSGGLLIIGAASATVMSITNFQMTFTDAVLMVNTGSAPFFSLGNGTAIFSYRFGSGWYAQAFGYNPVLDVAHASAVAILAVGGQNSVIDNDAVSGSIGEVQLLSSEASSADLSLTTFAGFSGTLTRDWLAISKNVKGPFYVKVRAYTSTSIPDLTLSTYDAVSISALAVNTTFSVTGSPYDGQILTFRIKDNGTSRTIAWPATFADGTAVLPTATTISTWHEIVVRYNSTDNKYYCIYASTGNDLYMKGDIRVADEAYGAGWDGSTEVPTKNAIYDKIETISAGGGLSQAQVLAIQSVGF